jgi:predicted RNA-binding Zn-ribbon protein involved in translation (DUF1610 family)
MSTLLEPLVLNKIFEQLRIEPPASLPDHFKTVCPKCSAVRTSGKRRRKPVLRVVILPGHRGVRYRCFHCGWQGVRSH